MKKVQFLILLLVLVLTPVAVVRAATAASTFSGLRTQAADVVSSGSKQILSSNNLDQLSGNIESTLNMLQVQLPIFKSQVDQLRSGTGVSIDSVSGPSSLSIGQTGTWGLKVSAPSGTNLIYAVNWGDNNIKCGDVAKCAVPTITQQSSTFTHSYSQAGTYTVKFSVYKGGSCDGGKCLDPEFPAAQTSLSVVVGGQGPTVIKGSGLVSLVYASSTENGQQLKATFNFKIANNTRSVIYIPQSYRPVWPYLVNTTRANTPHSDEGGCSMPVTYTTSNVPVVYDKTRQVSFLQVNPGQTINYTAMKSCSVNQLLSGNYIAKLGSLAWGTSPDAMTGSIDTNISTSNSLYIVGEQVPWLSGVTYTGDKDGVVVSGERLKKVTKVFFGEQLISKENVNWISDSKLTFVPPMRDPGSYPIHVEFVGGRSNVVTLSINQARPSLAVLSPNGGEVLSVKKPVTIRWNSSALSSRDMVNLRLYDSSIKCSSGVVGCWSSFPLVWGGVPNTGSYVWDTNTYYGDPGPYYPLYLSNRVSKGAVYKVMVSYIIDGEKEYSDYSDNYFTISSPTVATSTGATVTQSQVDQLASAIQALQGLIEKAR